MADAEFFADLPDGWKVYNFGDLVQTASGQVDPRAKPYAEMLHVGPDNIVEACGKLIDCRTAGELNLISGKYLFTPDDVLYSKIRPYLRKVALPDFTGVCSADMYPLRPASSRLVREYLYYWLLSEAFTAQAVSHQSRTGIPKINRQQLDSTSLAAPSPPEQRAIAHALRTVQRAKEAAEAVVVSARQLKQSLLRHLFTYGPVPIGEADRVPLKETEVGSVPEHWELKTLGNVAKIGNGSTPSRSTPSYWDGGSIPWLTSGKIHERIIGRADEFVTPTAQAECHLPTVKKGSVLVAITGQGKTLGNAARIEFDTCVSQHLAYLQPHGGGIRSDYLLEYLGTRYDHFRQAANAGGSTKGALTCGYLKMYPLPVPPIAEQQLIGEMAEGADRKIRTEEARVTALGELFRVLLGDLMTGRVRVC